jgi:hypothetical protein
VDYAGGNTSPVFGRVFPRGGRCYALLRLFLIGFGLMGVFVSIYNYLGFLL